MSKYFYINLPSYLLTNFRAVRDSLDNLTNILNVAEIVNTCAHCRFMDDPDHGFEVAVFTGDYHRILIKKDDGYFSMAIPFNVITNGDQICFNSDLIEEEVSGRFIAIMRNCIQTTKEFSIVHEEVIYSLMQNFSLDMSDAMKYYDTFASLIAEDHGYFRFDDDPVNANGDLHPRYHFDIFYKNSSSIKIGYDKVAKLDCIYSLFDHNIPKKYLTAR